VTRSKEVKEVVLVPDDQSKTTWIGTNLSNKLEDALVSFLREHFNIFAWKFADMPACLGS
jgi:hypothetical protein